MVTIVKHEWHSVDSQFAFELDETILSEIYPDNTEDEIAELLVQIETGYVSVEDVINDAWENDVEIEWERQYDDWYSDRKGGYDITYELGDESSWVEPEQEPEPTHKCTKCRWKGQSYETGSLWLREDGTVIPEDSDEDVNSIQKDVCPMCDSDLELTEAGAEKEKEREEMRKRWAEMDELKQELDNIIPPEEK
jgi:hypothetical protein